MNHIKHTFALLAACLSLAAAVAQTTAGSPLFQMRLVAAETPEAPQSTGLEKMTVTRTNSANGHIYHETFYVQKAVLLDEHDLKGTTVVTNTVSNQAEIDFELSAAGRKRFAEVTRQNIGKRLAIIIDGQLCSAPVIRSEITSGKGQITGNFTPQEARALSDKINAALKK
jgi:preprotein translocase subunit SecD